MALMVIALMTGGAGHLLTWDIRPPNVSSNLWLIFYWGALLLLGVESPLSIWDENYLSNM